MKDSAELKNRTIQGRKILNFSPDEFSVFVPVQVRFCDTDMMGHINNVSVIAFLETARFEYMNRLRKIAEQEGIHSDSIFSIILAEITCVYRAQMFVNDVIQVGIRIPFFGERIFYFDYVIVAESPSGDRRKTVDAQSVQVMYNYLDNKSIEVPDSFIKIVEKLEQRSIPKLLL